MREAVGLDTVVDPSAMFGVPIEKCGDAVRAVKDIATRRREGCCAGLVHPRKSNLAKAFESFPNFLWTKKHRATVEGGLPDSGVLAVVCYSRLRAPE